VLFLCTALAAMTSDDNDQRKMSDWMKVMLEEIERKQAETEEGQEELRRRQGPSADRDRPAEAPSDDTSTRR
jgi:hypothetical protein